MNYKGFNDIVKNVFSSCIPDSNIKVGDQIVMCFTVPVDGEKVETQIRGQGTETQRSQGTETFSTQGTFITRTARHSGVSHSVAVD